MIVNYTVAPSLYNAIVIGPGVLKAVIISENLKTGIGV